MTKLAGLFALALGTAVLAAAACGSDDGDEGGAPPKTPAEKFCDALATYIDDCGAKNPCDEALLADCADVTGMLNDGYLLAAATCMTEGNAPTKCLTDALGAIEASSAHHDLAKKVCDECAFGVDGCQDAFFAEGDGETQLVGKLVLPFGDSLVNEIAAECAQGLTCIPQFPTCVQGILAQRALPTETLACLISPPPSDDTPKCETISGGSGDPGSGGSGASGNPSGPGSGVGGSGATGGDGGAGPGGAGPGAGGSANTCAGEGPAGCASCCMDGDPAVEELVASLVMSSCGCDNNGPCAFECNSVCFGASPAPQCLTCLDAQVAAKSTCVGEATAVCKTGGCKDFYDCYFSPGPSCPAGPATCGQNGECPGGKTCIEFICQ